MKNKILLLGFILLFIVGFSFAKNNYSDILKSNIFSQQPPPPPPVTVTSILKNIPPPPPPALTTVLNIIGILYCSNKNSKVIIQDSKNNKENIYSQGDTIENAEIFKINKHSVLFLYNGKQTMLSMNNSILPSTNTALALSTPLNIVKSNRTGINLDNLTSQTSPKIMSARYVNTDTALKDLTADKNLLNTMSITPQVGTNGQVAGFSINNLPSNSIPVQMGLQNGDVVQSVNGVPINSLATAFQVYNNIMQTHQNVVTVQVLRNNQPIILTYHLQ